MPRALGEKQEIVDMVNRKRLGLLAGHLTQNQLQPDSKESDSVRKGKSRRSLTDKVFRIFLSVSAEGPTAT
jgi:hypothetical protein